MKLIKSTKLGSNISFKKLIFFYICIFCFILTSEVFSKTIVSEKFLQIKILDKVSSKNNKLEIKIGEEKKFKNLSIKALKCKNSEFDDNPEITAYLQVRDLTTSNKDKVFVFNGWTFASSPSIRPFDHPIYDIWLKKCYS